MLFDFRNKIYLYIIKNLTMLKNLYTNAFLCFCLSLPLYINAQTFNCDGTFYISLTMGGPPTTFFEITTEGGVNFEELFEVDQQLNALGLSTLDRQIYAVEFNGDNGIYQIQADGTSTLVFNEPSLTTWSAAAGAVDNNGVYAVHDRNLDMIFLYQTGGPTVTSLGSTTLFWDEASTGNTGVFDLNIDDIVFDPFDDSVMLTYQRFWDTNGPENTRGHLLNVDVDPSSPNFGMVSSIGQVDPDVIVHLGSLFFDTNGALHGYGAQTSGPLVQDRLVRINQNNASIELLGTGPAASGVDGCSCRNPLLLTKRAEIGNSTCNGTTIRYTINTNNLATLETNSLRFRDTLSFEGIITNLDLSQFPDATLIGGVGENFFELEDFRLSGEEDATIIFEVSTPLTGITVFNQARIYEMDGSAIDSDDPDTPEISDPTAVDIPVPISDETGELNFEICEGESVTINGEVFDMETSFIDTINIDGCDSLVNVNVVLLEDTERNETVELCPGEIIVINGETFNSAGQFTQLLTNVAGCDSTINLTITIGGTICNDCPDEKDLGNALTITKLKAGKYKFDQMVFFESSSQVLETLDDLEAAILNYLNLTELNGTLTKNKAYCDNVMKTIAGLREGNQMTYR